METIYELQNNILNITLNRPKVLNAISLNTINEILKIISLIKNSNTKLIILDGMGSSFCAGGDLIELYKSLENNNIKNAMKFLDTEYLMDFKYTNIKIPKIVQWKGYTMGGGIGLSINSDFKLVDETTKWAMPEIKLGFLPDVAMGYYFSKLSRGISQYLTLTGKILDANDLIFLGFSKYLIENKDYKKIKNSFFKQDFSNSNYDEIILQIKNLINPFLKEPKTSEIKKNIYYIDKYFNKKSLKEIFDSLERGNDEFAKTNLKILKSCSPLSLEIQFQKYEYNKKWSLKKTYDKDKEILKFLFKTRNVKIGIEKTLINKKLKIDWIPENFKEINYKEISNLLSK